MKKAKKKPAFRPARAVKFWSVLQRVSAMTSAPTSMPTDPNAPP